MISYTDGKWNATFDEFGALIKLAPVSELWKSHGGPVFSGDEAKRIIAELRMPKLRVRCDIDEMKRTRPL